MPRTADSERTPLLRLLRRGTDALRVLGRLELAEEVKKTVKEKTGVDLEMEIRYVSC